MIAAPRNTGPEDAAADRETASTEKNALRLWIRLLGASGLIEQTIRNRLHREFRMTLAKFDVLAELDRAGEPLTMTTLSRLLMVSNGNVTGVIDRLERDGLVRRSVAENDRRFQYIRLTSKGKKSFDRMAEANEAWISELMSGMKQSEIQTLSQLLKNLKAAVTNQLDTKLQ